MKKTTLILPFLVFLALGSPLAAHAQTDAGAERHVKLTLTPERNTIGAGETIMLALQQDIQEGWHTYWVNPGDAGTPPAIEWTLPEGFQTGKVHWPVAHTVTTGPLGSYAYEKDTTVLYELSAPDPLPAGPAVIKANVTILVCADICIPENQSFEITLNGKAAEQENNALIDAAYEFMPQEIEWPGYYTEQDGNFVLNLEMMLPALGKIVTMAQDIQLLPEEWGLVSPASANTSELANNVLTIKQKRGDRPLADVAKNDGRLEFVIAYIDLAGRRQGYHVSAFPIAINKAALTPAATPPSAKSDAPDVKKKTIKNGFDLSRALLFAFLGGLILNLMPCAFPVLSLKALKLCQLSGKDLNVARTQSLLYTGGILVSFLVFAAVILSLRTAGQAAGWGFHLQNPAFVALLSYLLFIIGLNLSGFFEVPARFANFGGKLADGHGYAASFFTGVLAALVATPCTAPFMAGALGYALTQPTLSVVAIFSALALGLAFPYLLLSFVPPLRAILPRPGAWMETFRQFLAFPMFGAAAWLAWVYGMQDGTVNSLIVLAGAVMLAFALWIFKHLPERGLRRVMLQIVAVLSALTILAPIVLIMPASQNKVAVEEPVENCWINFSKDKFVALESGNDPIFVDMTAAWCITCKVNERLTLNNPAIVELFADRGIKTVRGDWTDRDPDITAYLTSFDRSGVPIYVYYGPRNPVTGVRPDPVVLPQILTVDIVKNAVEGKN